MSHEVRAGAATRPWRCEMSGFTVVPRWTLNPVPGIGEHEVWIPAELTAASHRLANDAALPLSSVLLTAHAKVLGALAGEHEVCTGYAVDPHPPLPMRMTLRPRSWREVLRGIARAESDLLAHSDVPVDDRGGAPAPAEPLFETVFDPSAASGELAEGTVLRVGFVTERNLDCMTAVLAIFKAGGAYLPFEPHFPAERIARMLSRAGCRLVLTERGSSAVLDRALHSLSGVETLLIEAALAEGHSETDPDVNVWPQQLSYIFFTSGSTGEPKGAMCEHDGMLNHLLAKIDDLGIAERDVLAQTAPQCFDISLWQLLAALLVGGRTLLVEQEIILDAKRFIDKIVEGRVSVLQVVPSYLEVLLSYLQQHPRELPHLRRGSVTGEVLKKELVQRWFALKPAIKLMNAYGLTETSDDTNHEILDSVPRRERVPLGRPINNVRVYIVDEQLSPVPLGAPGEIVFAGMCVGRGYIGDSERTQRAFLTDPHHPYERLYRSGDYGRWLPEGKLEFLGRRDTQVKISGFRIEIGDIENALLHVLGVREDAVVVTERPDRSKHLVAFYTGKRQLDANALRDRLAASLPKYMVPMAFHWQNRLPLTDNEKVDKRALAALAAEREAA